MMSIIFETKKIFKVKKRKVYEGLLDLESTKYWMKGLVRIERMDEGVMKVGSEWQETRKMMGFEGTETLKLISMEPNKIIIYVDGTKGASGKGEHYYTYIIKELGDITEVTLRGEIKGLTGLSKLIGKLMVSSYRKVCTKDLEGLKKYLEN